ncbi:MAG: nitrilase-related carbon-nitrogen hydrolase [Gammaproteobacteria bacterium]
MKLGFYQYRPLFGKIGANLNKVVNKLDGVDADLIVLPELAFSGYYFKDRNEAFSLSEDPHESTTVVVLTELCQRNDFHLVTGFTERADDKVYNSALLLGPDGIEHTYRKLHLFNEEKFWFDPGDIPLSIQTVRGAQIGIMVCFDWVFPEVTRVLALQGAEIICQPANLVLAYCQQTMLSRSLENRVFSVTCNRFGADKRPQGELKFTGRSQIVAPNGDRLAAAAAQRDALVVMDIDPQLAHEKHITRHNDVLADRRPEFYQVLNNN